MRIDDSWRRLNAPDFSPYSRLDPDRAITMLGADPFAPGAVLPPHVIGAVSVSVPVYAEDGFQLRASEVEALITPRTRCLLLTNPNNPTGAVYSRSNLEELAVVAARHDLMVIVDQAFERQVYDGIEYVDFATLPGMADRTITIFGTSKDLGLSGFRVAYMVAPREVVDILKIATFNMHGATNTFAQYGVAAAYDDPSYLDEWLEIFRARRAYGQRVLDGIPGVTCPLPDGGFYFWADVAALGGGEAVRDHLIDDAQIGVLPGTMFGTRGADYLRIMYGTVADEARYVEGIDRIAASLERLGARR